MLFLPNQGKAWQQPEQGEQEAPLVGGQTSLHPAQGEFSCSSLERSRVPCGFPMSLEPVGLMGAISPGEICTSRGHVFSLSCDVSDGKLEGVQEQLLMLG